VTPLETALALCQEDFDSFKVGTANQPAEGSSDWYRLRSATLGLAFLKRLRVLGLDDNPIAADRVYQQTLRVFKETT
jgi:hypothetical protein